jgi:hypothetical protein
MEEEAARSAEQIEQPDLSDPAADWNLESRRESLRTVLLGQYRNRLGPEVAAAKEPLLKVLFLHSAGVAILLAYAHSPAEGRSTALAAVQAAIQAAGDALVELVDEPDKVWRYPPLLNYAIYRLKLDDITGIHEFAVQIGAVLSASPVDTALAFAQTVLMILAMLFSGPGGGAIVLGIAAADVGVSGTQTARSYLKERENALLWRAQEFATVAPGPGQLTQEQGTYGETALSGAMTLLAGLALVSGVAARLTERAVPPPTRLPDRKPVTPEPVSSVSATTPPRSEKWSGSGTRTGTYETTGTAPPKTGATTSTTDSALPAAAKPNVSPTPAAPAATAKEPAPIGFGERKQPLEPRGRSMGPFIKGDEYDLLGHQYSYTREWGHDFGPAMRSILPPGSKDPAFPSLTVGRPNASHVVSVYELFQNPKFLALPTRVQIEIAWHPVNIRALSETYNIAQGERTFAEVIKHKKLGLTVDPAFRQTMTAEYVRTKSYMDFMIDQAYRKLGLEAAGESWALERGMDPERMIPLGGKPKSKKSK